MMAEVWKSRSNYQLALEEKKNQIEKEEKRSHEKRCLATELQQVQPQKVTAKWTVVEILGTRECKNLWHWRKSKKMLSCF